MEHPIGEMMHSTMNSIKDMVDVNTVVGDPVVAATGATIIPVSTRLLWLRDGRRRSAGRARRAELHPPMESRERFPLQAEAAQEYRCSR